MNNEITAKIERIRELKSLLKSTDYKAIKYAEGELSAEEYAETREQRRAWRAEINELQAELRAELQAMRAAKVTPETGVEEG